MGILLLLLASGYTLYLWRLTIQWRRIPEMATESAPSSDFSIIIPVRNESTNLPALVESLEKVNYPKDRFEVIIVDDHSTDSTRELIANRQRKSSLHIHLLQLDEYVGSPKKAAITKAIAKASFDIIVTTDGDCTIPSDWLSVMDNAFKNKTIQLVAGPVAYSQNGLFAELQALEMLVLCGFSACMIAKGTPVFGNGAHLAYRKSLFHELKGFSGNTHIASGDDEFIIKKAVATKGSDATMYLKHPQSIVYTAPNKSFRQLVQQRLRWAGKWKAHKEFRHGITAGLVFLLNLIFLGSIAAGVIGLAHWSIVIATWCIKFIGEATFCRSLGRYFDIKINFVALVLLGLLYPLYVVFFGLGANVNQYQWKGRKYHE